MPNKGERRGKDKPREIRLSNTNSAFGAAFAAAVAKSGKTMTAAPSEKKQEVKAPVKTDAPDSLSSIGRLAGDRKKLAEKLGIGEMTLTDIIKELEKPGRDPRDEMPKPILRSDVLEMKDLKEGMILKGTVRNVIDFGVFVDIGVHQDGLVHISQITNKKYIKHPLEVVSVGDIVEVKVLGCDVQKNRIQLSMII